MNRTYDIQCPGAAAPVVQPPAPAGVDMSIWTWTHPTPGYCVTSGFRTSSRPNHQGVDINARFGTPIHAAAAGVAYLGRQDLKAGLYVYVKHAGGSTTTYFHMNSQAVGNGQRVAMGDVIGYVGQTGNASPALGGGGPHLHFEVHIPDVWKNWVSPVPFMRARGVNISC
jgi:murein DD-endopeptidase MepM/ murein hydrolase activator NlpD